MKLKHTKFQVALEILGMLLMIGMIVFVCIRLNQLPRQIPGRYNALGEVDTWVSKSNIIILPIVCGLLYTFLTIVTFLPKTWGLPVKITDLNRAAVYCCTRSLLIFIKIEFLGIFFYLAYNMTATQPLPALFTPILLFIVIETAIYFIIRMYRIGKQMV